MILIVSVSLAYREEHLKAWPKGPSVLVTGLVCPPPDDWDNWPPPWTGCGGVLSAFELVASTAISRSPEGRFGRGRGELDVCLSFAGVWSEKGGKVALERHRLAEKGRERRRRSMRSITRSQRVAGVLTGVVKGGLELTRDTGSGSSGRGKAATRCSLSNAHHIRRISPRTGVALMEAAMRGAIGVDFARQEAK